MRLVEKFIRYVRRHPERLLVYNVFFTALLPLLMFITALVAAAAGLQHLGQLLEVIWALLLAAELLLFPWLLTGINLWYLVKRPAPIQPSGLPVGTGLELAQPSETPAGKDTAAASGDASWFSPLETMSEVITFPLGIVLTLFYISFATEIVFADWMEVLYNREVHTPIATWTMPTLLVLAAVGMLGYLFLRLCPLKAQPPLMTVLSMSAIYIGCLVCGLWIVQVAWSVFLMLFPANCLILSAKTIRRLVWQWQELHGREEAGRASGIEESAFQDNGARFAAPAEVMTVFQRLLSNSRSWPWLALLLALPLLGLIIMILTLFGQKPDSIIQAWTQTSQWNLSQQISPPNLHYDEHYLCTAAASGHRRVVKPIRMGVRHGHPVVVNRQLCIANAFEQILEERLPGFHRRVRHFYDTYGFPIARHIKTPLAADITYLLMKPLEWLFLAVIYLCDPKPENRIAMQYISPVGTGNEASEENR